MPADPPFSLLRWPGGKTRVLDDLEAHFRLRWWDAPGSLASKSCTFWEPFCGGLSVTTMVLRRFRPARVVCGDINSALVDFYTCLCASPDGMIAALRGLPDDYYANRALFNELKNQEGGGEGHRLRVGALFYYLNYTCFNGLYRENSRGDFNTPRGDRVFHVREQALRDAALELARVEFVTAHYGPFMARMIREAAPGDLCYCDAPYDQTFNAYSSTGFSRADQTALHGLCGAAAGRGACVIASNNDTGFIRQLHAPPCVVWPLSARRSINPAHPTPSLEVVVLFPPASPVL